MSAARPLNPFPNYTELRRRVPAAWWHPVRAVSVAVFLGLCASLWFRPAGGLFFFWRVLVPLLPVTFLVAPGMWRNVCPLAAANQAPRLFGWTKAKKQPALLRNKGYAFAIVFFAAIVTTRKPLLDHNGGAMSVLLTGLLVGAFLTGREFKGKSGWCTSICPLLPVQRMYGQTPFAKVPNSHCQPCVGCTKNCYDFNPGAAYQADMHEADPEWSASRKLFAGAFPGIIYGFFTIGAKASTAGVYGHVLLWAGLGAGAFFALDALLPVTPSQAAALGGAAAANLFYWYQGPAMAKTWGTVFGASMPWLSPVVRLAIAAVTVAWVARTFLAERRFKETVIASAAPVKLSATRTAKLSEAASGDGPVVVFEPDERRVVAAAGQSLLDVAEVDGQPVEAGCRVGMCGADPIVVLEGMEHLSGVTDDEATTLRRLGLGNGARMACSAVVTGTGPVCVSLQLERLAELESGGGPAEPALPVDPRIRTVVVLGNGIAGVTAADFVRRNHPDCEIHVVGKEAHHLYNRMGISRLVFGRSAMQGLHLLPDDWYDEHRITTWLNTKAVALDAAEQTVRLGTGEELRYDRLILATGSRSFIPDWPGWGKPGTFALREADDAIGIRRYAQEHGAATAVVVGGGLLGVEAAHALHLLGLRTVILERNDHLLAKQVDARAAELLTAYLANLGIQVLHRAAVARLAGRGALTGVTLKDGRTLPADVFLAATGIQPNVELAAEAGIAVGRGVLVDDRMRTSAKHVFAAGDVAEYRGAVHGLWPVAVNQAETAARSALGADDACPDTRPLALLKGIGLDLLSIGQFQPGPGDDAVVIDDDHGYRYAKIVSRDDRVVGGVLLGRPEDHAGLIKAVKDGARSTPLLEEIAAP